MKKMKLLVLALLFCSALQSNAQTTCIDSPYTKAFEIVGYNNNAVENPAFEATNTQWTFGPDSTVVKIVNDPAGIKGKVGRLISGVGDGYLSQNLSYINLVQGDSLTMSAYFRKRAGAGALSITLQMRINYYNGTDNVMSQTFTPTSTWGKYSFKFQVPASTSAAQVSIAQVMFYRSQNDTIWVDSIQIQDPAIGVNADFESGTSPWLQLPSSSRVLLSTPGALGTGNCMKIISDMSGSDGVLVQNVPNLANSQYYTIRAYLKSMHNPSQSSDETNMHVRINYIGGGEVDYDTLVKPTSTWTLFTYTFRTPDTGVINASQIQAILYRNKQDSVYVDNLELVNSGTFYNMVNYSVPRAPLGVFQDSFIGTSGQTLDFTKWLVVKKTWGANNNGVVPENIKLLTSGGIRFHGHGNLYGSGTYDTVYGASNTYGNGKEHVGACIATKDYYASGKYEIVAKVAPGLVDAFWTFHYIEDPNYQAGGIKNTEIDFEFPGAPTDTVANPGYSGHKSYIDDMNLNSWGGLCNGDGYDSSKRYDTSVKLSDGFHKYTIDWHSGGGGVTPSVTWYVDDHFARRIVGSGYVPFRASRLWLGVWYSKYTWIGDSATVCNYVDTFCEVRSVKITPYYEANDEYVNETDPIVGYVSPQYKNYPKYASAWKHANESNGGGQIPGQTGSEDMKVGMDMSAHQFTVFLSGSNENYITGINILNMNGQVVRRESYPAADMNVKVTSSYSGIPSGLYLVQCNTSGGQVYYRKLLVMN